ncbi:MAG: glucose-6-phosphate isomerase, partial [Bacteroidales bacterium]|nr:glucose-6-phosphate isomerase [Bacteroidales bacterium]
GKDGARERIVAVTDAARGALKTMSNDEGYKTFVIPDDVGGRFSVLTPVGLIPIALAGYDIRALVKGAAAMAAKCYERNHDNIAVRYAAIRNEYYDSGKSIELLVNYNPKLHSISEWWKQLYGESEGKDGKGIFPASATFTTDLHSLGQYVQDGQRILFETMFSVEKTNKSLIIGEDAQNLDGLNYLAGKHLEYCNQMAEAGSRLSHMDGGVPCISLSMEKIDEYNLGELFYFFEVGCGVSAYMLGVNPFDQPGVEGYKKNMFALLGKPGYEVQGDELRKRL